MARFNRILALFFLALFLPHAHGAVTSLVRGGETLFKAGKYQKMARLSSLGKADLGYATKAENVQGLLDIAAQENRIDAIDQIQLAKRYSAKLKGDETLLACLKVSKCQPERFIDTVNTSELHSEIALRQPGLNPVQVSHAVGEVTENLMVHYIKGSGWIQVQGQIGRQGIDGLFVKIENGVVKDVLIVESKYNGSKLGETNHGTQMSDMWVRRKLFELKNQYPQETIYQDIDQFVNAGSYRAIMWNMKVENNALKVSIDKVKSKGEDVIFAPVKGSADEMFARPFENDIDINAPKNSFEKNLVDWYNSELQRFGSKVIN